MLIIHRDRNTLTQSISCPGGENGEWKACKWVLTHTHCGWKRGGHQTALYFKPLKIPTPPHVSLSQSCATVKTRKDDFSPKAACYITSSVLSFCSFFDFFCLSLLSPPAHMVIKPEWSHQASHSHTRQIKAQQCEMCRPFWLRQSWWHAEQLLIRRRVWQSLSPLHQTGSTSSPKQSEGEEEEEGGRWWRRMKG